MRRGGKRGGGWQRCNKGKGKGEAPIGGRLQEGSYGSGRWVKECDRCTVHALS